MIDDTEPGRGARDLELQRRWREQFDELPSVVVDARIRAAARGTHDDKSRQQPRSGIGRGTRRWFRVAPIAAAASVAILAVGLVRLIPREEYAAIPAAPPAPTAPTSPASRAAEPAAGAESIAPKFSAPAPTESSADSQTRQAPAFVSDAPPVALEQLAIPAPLSREVPAQDRAADVAAAARRDPSSPAPEPTPSLPVSGGLRNSESRAVGPTSAITTQSESATSVAKAAESRPMPPTAAVLADAARRTGTGVDEIRIVEVTPVTWRDGSLGCGEPDTPAPDGGGVHGFVVTVEAAGERLRYHTDADAQFRTCE